MLISNSYPIYSQNNTKYRYNTAFGQNKNEDNIKEIIFYINDLHGQNIRMERMYNAVKQFDTFTPQNTDKMKFASGDIMLGEDEKHVKVANKFLNLAGFLATALGNHECDMPTNQFVNVIKDKNYKIL